MTTSLQMPNGRWRSLGLLYGDKQLNIPVEWTAHSAGFVVKRFSVPVGRRSPGALSARAHASQTW
jgi:hypothetical protein